MIDLAEDLNETLTENIETNSEQVQSGNPINGSDRNKFWNISNDEHYNPKSVIQEANVAAAASSTKHVSTSLTLQHTKAAIELNTFFFPTHLSSQKLRNFHRYPLKPFYTESLSSEHVLNMVRSVLRKFKPTTEKPQFQLNFSSKNNFIFATK